MGIVDQKSVVAAVSDQGRTILEVAVEFVAAASPALVQPASS